MLISSLICKLHIITQLRKVVLTEKIAICFKWDRRLLDDFEIVLYILCQRKGMLSGEIKSEEVPSSAQSIDLRDLGTSLIAT